MKCELNYMRYVFKRLPKLFIQADLKTQLYTIIHLLVVGGGGTAIIIYICMNGLYLTLCIVIFVLVVILYTTLKKECKQHD